MPVDRVSQILPIARRAHGCSIHSCHNCQLAGQEALELIRSVVVPRVEFTIQLLGDRHYKRPPRHRFHFQRLRKETVVIYFQLQPISLRQYHHLARQLSQESFALRLSAVDTRGSAGRLIAMAGAMKTFWVLLLVVAMAAVAAQAHDGVDHGPAGAPHAEAPEVGSAAELLVSWLSPLLLAGAAFTASVLWP